MDATEAHVTARLRSLRKRAGLSMEKLAVAMGYAHGSSIQHYENPQLFKDDALPPKVLAKLSSALVGQGNPPITREEVLDLGGPFVTRSVLGTMEVPADAEKMTMTGDRLIPLYGSVRGGPDGQFELQGQALDQLQSPPVLQRTKDAYAVRVHGDSMWPKYEDGQTVYIDPSIIPRRTNYVVAQVRREGDDVIEAFVKRFVRWNTIELVLEQFNPDKQLTFPAERVVSVHRIVFVDESS